MLRIKELSIKEGAMDLEFKQKPEIAQYIAAGMASILNEAPNYAEMKFEVSPKGAHEWITVTVMKGSGKTAHQLRREAEQELAAFKANA